jgi:hypothetical protein
LDRRRTDEESPSRARAWELKWEWTALPRERACRAASAKAKEEGRRARVSVDKSMAATMYRRFVDACGLGVVWCVVVSGGADVVGCEMKRVVCESLGWFVLSRLSNCESIYQEEKIRERRWRSFSLRIEYGLAGVTDRCDQTEKLLPRRDQGRVVKVPGGRSEVAYRLGRRRKRCGLDILIPGVQDRPGPQFHPLVITTPARRVWTATSHPWVVDP